MYHSPDHSALWLNVKAESTHQFMYIDKAVLNGENPIDFWKENNPFVQILETNIELQLQDKEGKRDYITANVSDKKFRKFMEKLKKEVGEDELIKYIREEFQEMQSLIETFFFEELKRRM